MHGNDFASMFAMLFSKAGLFCLWGTFLVGAIARWVANARVKGQLKFLNSYDRSLISLKDTPSLSQSELREKSESHFRNYYPSKGGGRAMRTFDRLLGGETSSWAIIDRVVHLAFDQHRPGTATERARYVLASTQSLTHFFRFFSLGALHRLGAASPALLLLLGAMGTYTGFLTALPLLNPSDIADASALGTTLQTTLARMSSYTGFALLGSLLAFASVLANAIWDAERSFQSAAHRLAHIVEFLGGLERSKAGQGMSHPADSAGHHSAGRGRKGNLKSVPQPEAFVEEETPEEKIPEENVPEEKALPVASSRARQEEETETAPPAVEVAEKMPVARRQRSEVVKAEADWGPLPLSAVPSPKKKPIRVEAADVPKPESVRSDDDIVAEEVVPEITVAERPNREEAPLSAPAQVPSPAPAPVAAKPAPQQASAPAPVKETSPPSAPVAAPSLNAPEFQFPETALPSDWDDQIRGLKNQLEAMQPRPTEIPEPAPEMPASSPVPQEIPYDEGLEKTIVGVPQLVETRDTTSAPGPSRASEAPMMPDFSTPSAPAESHDSPTEAELLAMMVPKEWSTQRPADTMPPNALPEDFDTLIAPVAPAPPPAPQRAAAPAPAPVSTRPAPPPAPALTAAEQDRLAILEHRMDKVSLYLSKAAEDLKEGIISQEMFDDETARWRQEVDTLNKELLVLTAKKAA